MRLTRFIPLLFLFSCLDDPDCLPTNTNLVKIDFKNADGTARTLSVIRITASGLSSPLYSGENVSAVQLPLNPNSAETTFTVVEAASSKTISFRYAIVHRMVSEKCGAFAYYSDLEVTESDFTTTRVRNPFLLSNVSTANVEIFY